MLVSTPTKPYVHRSATCDSGMAVSPTFHRRTCTPPRTTASYDSPMLPPSPLRQRPLFPLDTNAEGVHDNPYQSPHKSPALAQNMNSFFAPRPQPITADDKEGSIFLSSASTINVPLFSTSTSQPLLTPVKQAHRVSSRSVLAGKSSDNAFGAARAAPPTELMSAARVGVGTKRKSTPLVTPFRPDNITPLKTTQSKHHSSSVSFECLAPLSAPRFNERTPQTRAETEAYLKTQTASLTRLRLSDQNVSVNEDPGCDEVASDSGCEIEEDEPDRSLFLTKPKTNPRGVQQHPRSLVFQPALTKDKEEEVVEAVSPGGHVTKRRARSRPLSAELRGQAFKVPKSPIRQIVNPRVGANRPRHSGPANLPSVVNRGLPSPASSSEGGSPRPRRRIAASHTNTLRPNTERHPPKRAPLSRIDSAALFFGPAIPAPLVQSTRTRTTSSSNLSFSAAQGARQATQRPNLANRHSYAGPQSSADGDDYDREFMWNTFQARNLSPSPGSSPSYPVVNHGHSRKSSIDMDDEDMDMFFAGEHVSSFVLNVTKESPSPVKPTLPIKYKSESGQRDRDNSLVSDEDDMVSTGSSVGGSEFLNAVPKASTSVSSICSDEALVTPGITPDGASGWPNARIVVKETDEGHVPNSHPYNNESEDVDAFIMRALATASKGNTMPKKAPGTPVKKARMNYFGNSRPWQSAVAAKVGLKDDYDLKNGKAPRKSMPAVFPPVDFGSREARVKFRDTDTDEEEYSPSMRRGKDEYNGLGLGMPPPPSNLKDNSAVLPRNRWLMRRSSSSAFSSGSDSASLSSTPTRTKGISIDWHLPKPRIPLRLSPSGEGDLQNKAYSPRSTSGSSTSSLTAPSSPTNSRRPGLAIGAPRGSVGSRNVSESFGEFDSAEEQPGRFERDFDEIEEVGSGEFGKVMKVRSKTGDNDLYAIKKSKRFEGVKHRRRLREEVDILKHLSEAALTQYADGRHPNVLAYIDSWEEDEALFICTELCESGNLARFLWEYGRVFPHLDEARVWKVIVDLSNGLNFIHNSGVIHLDIKPSNVFVTKEGRFKIGDFGMASLWPRSQPTTKSDSRADSTGVSSTSYEGATTTSSGAFEREGDKLYLAPEVLQGRYGKAADVFSFGMTILETASNIVVPDQLSCFVVGPRRCGPGEGWQRLRREDFSQVDLDENSTELVDLIQNMMRTDPAKRLTVAEVCAHPVVRRAREEMEKMEEDLRRRGKSAWGASPLASVRDGFLEGILGCMDTRG